MTNVRFPSIDSYRDIESVNAYHVAVSERGIDPATMLQAVHAKSRDNARTPMQWSAGPNAGFTSGTPWLPVNPNHTSVNAEQARADADSVFHHYRRLIALRKANPVIVHGRYQLLLPQHPQIYAYTRTLGDERLLVVCNFSADAPRFELPASVAFRSCTPLIGNYALAQPCDLRAYELRPYEAQVWSLN